MVAFQGTFLKHSLQFSFSIIVKMMEFFDPFDDDELPPLIEPDREHFANDLPNILHSGRNIAMPSECTTNPLQRALADSIIRMVSLDEMRILFACGAKVSKQYKLRWSRLRHWTSQSQHCWLIIRRKFFTPNRMKTIILFASGERTGHSRSLRFALRRLAEKHRSDQFVTSSRRRY